MLDQTAGRVIWPIIVNTASQCLDSFLTQDWPHSRGVCTALPLAWKLAVYTPPYSHHTWRPPGKHKMKCGAVNPAPGACRGGELGCRCFSAWLCPMCECPGSLLTGPLSVELSSTPAGAGYSELTLYNHFFLFKLLQAPKIQCYSTN